MNIIMGIAIAMRTRAEVRMRMGTLLNEKANLGKPEEGGRKVYICGVRGRRRRTANQAGAARTHTAVMNPPLEITRRSTPVALRTAATSPQPVSRKCLGELHRHKLQALGRNQLCLSTESLWIAFCIGPSIPSNFHYDGKVFGGAPI